jgi:hypothetical protein
MASEGKCLSICLKKQAIIVKAPRSTLRVVILGAIWSFGSRTEGLLLAASKVHHVL